MTLIVNRGTAKAFPIITILGPGDLSIIQNERTRARLNFQYTMQTGETITIDMRPGRKTAISSFTDNLLTSGGMSPSDLGTFAVDPGETFVSILILNDGPTTRAFINFEETFLTFDG